MTKTNPITIKKSDVTKYGKNSTKIIDVIKVYGDSDTVYARKGNDKITIYKGDNHFLCGGDGNDTIEVKKGNFHSVNGDKGNDTIKIKGGNYHYVFGDAGNDTIYVDTTVNLVMGGAGNDTIYVRKNATGGTLSGTAGGIQGGSGNDIITVQAGIQHQIRPGSGNDTVKLIGGSGHDVFLDKGKNTVNISVADVTLYQSSKKSVDKITVNWSKDIGTLQINTVANASSKYKDNLTVKGVKSSDVAISYALHNSNTLVIADYTYTNTIEIIDWVNNKSFSGIKFDDTKLSFSEINKRINSHL